jgi:hypothetical protein
MAKAQKVVSLKDRIQEQVVALKKDVEEKKKGSEDPRGDKELREAVKKLKRLQRKFSLMTAMEKRAESRAKKPEEKKEEAPEEAASESAEAAG